MESDGPDLDLIFGALGDPTRRAMLTELLAGEQNVSDLALPFALSLAAVSKHLRVLARAGLVSQRRSGREMTCRLEPVAMNAAMGWMQGFGAFEGADFAEVERLLAEFLKDENEADPAL